MGNCQAVDNATLVIQHPSGRADKLYCPVSASEIMKLNPGHYVALLLTTTLYSSAAAAPSATTKHSSNNNNMPLRITRIKLLRPTDTLVLGHVYRLVTTQEVMKGLLAKKQAKQKQLKPEDAEKYGKMVERQSTDFGAVVRRTDPEKNKQVKHERHSSRGNTPVSSAAASKSRAWQPALKSISEAGS